MNGSKNLLKSQPLIATIDNQDTGNFEHEPYNSVHPHMPDWDDDDVVVIDLTEDRSNTFLRSKDRHHQVFENSDTVLNDSLRLVSLENSLSSVPLDHNTPSEDSVEKDDDEDGHRAFSVSSSSSRVSAPDGNFLCQQLVPNDDEFLASSNVTSNQYLKNGKLKSGLKSKSLCLDRFDTFEGPTLDNNNQQSVEKNTKTKVEQKLAPVKVRPWEQRNLTMKPRNQAYLYEPEDSPSPNQFINSDSGSPLSSTAMTPLSEETGKKHDLPAARKFNLDCIDNGRPATAIQVHTIIKQSAIEEPFQRSLDRPVKPIGIYRGVLGRWTPLNEKGEYQFNGRKARSSDFLDKMETSVSSRSRTRSSMGYTPSTPPSCKMTRIEKNLFLGNMEAATDVILLESNAITHIISDLPDEDLLSRLVEAIDFIDSATSKGGSVLVHCFRGRSRSATVVIAYLMHKHHYKLEKAFFKVKTKREIINPHLGFLAQLKLFEAMDYTLDPGNIQYKMFRLFCASERMRKAKILFRDSLDKVLDTDPAGGLPGSAEAAAAAASKGRYPMIFKCRKCKRTLASAFNMLPHVRGETPNWMDEMWARLSEEDVIDDASSPAGLNLCSQSVFITPVGWMEQEIKQNLSGRLYCPSCQVRVGNYSWVLGDLCKGCGATVLPAFQLDVTEIIFRTHNRYLQSGYINRGPILV